MALTELAKGVSCRASDEYVAALRDLAWRLRLPMADVIRQAIDATYGSEPELSPFQVSTDGQEVIQLDNSATKEVSNVAS